MAKVQQLDFGAIILNPEAYRQQQQCKSRKCLSCSETFPSTGAGNRICGGCKRLEAWTTPADFSIHAAF